MEFKFAVTLAFCLFVGTVTAMSARGLVEGEDEEDEGRDIEGGYSNQLTDPCETTHCGTGKECDINERGRAVCVCAHKCPQETDARAKVCSTQNKTFDSECDLYRQKCICHRKGAECQDWKIRHAHLDYFGECTVIPECLDSELEEYPERMRQWLYLVMEELATRRDLDRRSMELAQKAKRHPKKWVIPVIWKFCDLDTSNDRTISEKELRPISAPLKLLEHCTGRFLQMCDLDQSGEIDLEEWGLCLGLEKDEIEDLCDPIQDQENQ